MHLTINITVSVGELCAEVTQSYEGTNITLLAYYCTIIDGKILISVHDMYKWVKVNNLLKHKLLPADIQIAKKC
jgi:8-oxo-dGTP diphosphatase